MFEQRAMQSPTELEAILRRSESLVASSALAMTMVHDLRGYFEAICNLSFLIGKQAGSEEDVRVYAAQLEEQCGNVRELIERTLDLNRSPEVMCSTELATILEAALRVHRPKIAGKSLDVRKRFSKDSSAVVHAGEMLQVFSNLVANAIDVLPHHGVLSIRMRRNRDHISITVADNGSGIPRHLADRVFEPFFTTKRDQGTGLGLAVSRSIIERHRGTIRLRSRCGAGQAGTVFRITLPLKAVHG